VRFLQTGSKAHLVTAIQDSHLSIKIKLTINLVIQYSETQEIRQSHGILNLNSCKEHMMVIMEQTRIPPSHLPLIKSATKTKIKLHNR